MDGAWGQRHRIELFSSDGVASSQRRSPRPAPHGPFPLCFLGDSMSRLDERQVSYLVPTKFHAAVRSCGCKFETCQNL